MRSARLAAPCLGGARGFGTGRQGDRLGEGFASGINRQVRAFRKRQHLGEDADILLAEQRALLDAALGERIGKAGDVVVVLALGPAAEYADEIGMQVVFVHHQVRAEALNELIVEVLLVAGDGRHHQLALEAGDVERHHIGRPCTWFGGIGGADTHYDTAKQAR